MSAAAGVTDGFITIKSNNITLCGPKTHQNMLRRKPTRIELTTDDVQDYEAIKKKAEEQRRKQQEIETNRNKTKAEKKAEAAAAEAEAAAAAKEPTRRQVVASRIGLTRP